MAITLPNDTWVMHTGTKRIGTVRVAPYAKCPEGWTFVRYTDARALARDPEDNLDTLVQISDLQPMTGQEVNRRLKWRKLIGLGIQPSELFELFDVRRPGMSGDPTDLGVRCIAPDSATNWLATVHTKIGLRHVLTTLNLYVLDQEPHKLLWLVQWALGERTTLARIVAPFTPGDDTEQQVIDALKTRIVANLADL